MNTRFTGVFPILATPFHDDESVDFDSLQRLVGFMAELGVDGVTVLGVLGESNRMQDRERADIVRAAVAAAGPMPVIVGASHSGTRAALGLSRSAQELGAGAVMLTPQAEAVPNEQRVFEYFRTVAEGIDIPVVVQDHPASTGVHMTVPLMVRMVNEIPSVACIKEEAVPTPPKIRAMLAAMTARRVPILTGLGALYGQFDLESGSSGFNTGFAFPEVLMAMVRHARAGRMDAMRAIYRAALPLIVFEQQPGVAVRKEILRRRGLMASSKVRHPGGGLDAAAMAQLEALLDQAFPGADLTRRIPVPTDIPGA